MLLPHDVFFSVVGGKRNGIALMELKYLQNEYGISVDALMAKAKYLGVVSSKHYSDYCKNLGSADSTKKSESGSITKEKLLNLSVWFTEHWQAASSLSPRLLPC